MKKYKRGYTQGTYDMFHIGHLNLLNNAKDQCEFLIVGVNADTLVQDYKHKTPVVNENDRAQIVSNIKCVDECHIVTTLDKIEIRKMYDFDVVFIGSDWVGNDRWEKTKDALARIGIDVVFLPYTQGVSSTSLRPQSSSRIEE